MIYETAANQLQFIYISDEAAVVYLEVFGLDSKLIKSVTVNVEKGINYLDENIETLANGMYMATLKKDEKTTVKKFLKSTH